MVEKKLKNYVVVSALACAAVFYLVAAFSAWSQKTDWDTKNKSAKKQSDFACVFSESEIVGLRGTIASSPQKIGRFYAFDLLAVAATKKNQAKASCRGQVKVFVSAATIEAFFPGKLYSAAQGGGFFADLGARVSLHGNFRDGIFYAESASTTGWGQGLSGKIWRFRALCRLQFRRLLSAWGNAGGLLLALLSGAREYTEKDVADSFRKAGLAHILALSGMHLSLVSTAAVWAGKRLAGKKYVFVVQLAAILFFVWFAGDSPSLFRALLCSVLIVSAGLAGLSMPNMLYVLSASFLLHSFFKPSDLTNVAFMLSYAALFGILVFGEKVNSFSARFLPPKIAAPISASLGAQICTAPISLIFFGTFAPIGIVAAVVVVPVVTIFICAGAVCLAACLIFPFLVPFAGFVLHLLYEVIKVLVFLFAQFPQVRLW